jgi:peptidoglycan/LPS O-acetylase OafA/YrhL
VSASQEKIPILDAMRFVAALTVMLVHYELIMGHFVLYGTASTSALSWFFVLSGFILSYTYPTVQGNTDISGLLASSFGFIAVRFHRLFKCW